MREHIEDWIFAVNIELKISKLYYTLIASWQNFPQNLTPSLLSMYSEGKFEEDDGAQMKELAIKAYYRKRASSASPSRPYNSDNFSAQTTIRRFYPAIGSDM